MVDRIHPLRRWLVTVIGVLAVVIFLIDVTTPKAVSLDVLYAGLVWLALWTPYPRFALIVAGGCTILAILGFFLAPPGGVAWMVAVNRGLVMCLIWVTTILALLRKQTETERDRLVRDLMEALTQVKTLQGLLSVCIVCKRMRDAHGEWQKLEHFLESHSEAITAPVLCRRCEEEMALQAADSE
jgi:hypothetical protein